VEVHRPRNLDCRDGVNLRRRRAELLRAA